MVAVLSVAAVLLLRGDLRGFPFGIRGSDTNLLELWDQGDYDAVIATAKDSLAQDPVHALSLVMGGFAQYYTALDVVDQTVRNQRLQNATAYLRKALIVPNAPLMPEVHYVLAKTYFERGRLYMDLVVRHMEMAIETGYRAEDSLTYLALAHGSLGDHQQSARVFEQAIADARSGQLYVKAAEEQMELGAYGIAEEHLRTAIEISEDEYLTSVATELLIQTLILDEEYSRAEQLLLELRDANPDSADAYYYLGIVYDLTDRPVEARSMWRQAREIDPQHTDALRHLADMEE